MLNLLVHFFKIDINQFWIVLEKYQSRRFIRQHSTFPKSDCIRQFLPEPDLSRIWNKWPDFDRSRNWYSPTTKPLFVFRSKAMQHKYKACLDFTSKHRRHRTAKKNKKNYPSFSERKQRKHLMLLNILTHYLHPFLFKFSTAARQLIVDTIQVYSVYEIYKPAVEVQVIKKSIKSTLVTAECEWTSFVWWHSQCQCKL